MGGGLLPPRHSVLRAAAVTASCFPSRDADIQRHPPLPSILRARGRSVGTPAPDRGLQRRGLPS